MGRNIPFKVYVDDWRLTYRRRDRTSEQGRESDQSKVCVVLAWLVKSPCKGPIA